MRAVSILHEEERIPHGHLGQISAPAEVFGATDGVCDQRQGEKDEEYNVMLRTT